MFEDVVAGDVAVIYATVAVVVFFLWFGALFYQGRLARNGEAAQFIAATILSVIVALVWPLAMAIVLVSLPFYVKDNSTRRRRA